ncbi:hypothetical protein MKW98_015275 [Papaver atlanticum]|uniref:Uncharacterized protein n=1 Tax=Papaver atlanticum TaxID=357466 RepID=A0AAD4T6Q1_9MAGN|nr:hypothetical protein MKW98_015275 [Papaver atlanticum]
MNPDTTKFVRQISKCTIKPHQAMESKQPTYLTPWDLSFLIFNDPTPTITFIHQLKHSLSMTLTHFYPLSGRMVTKKQDNPPFYGIYVDSSNDSVGAEFIHAAIDITMMDILTPTDVPLIVQSFFALEGAICHDRHTEPLLVVQVTENLRKASKQAGDQHIDGSISRPPITKRWFLEDNGDPFLINLPFCHHKEFIKDRYERPLLRERMFHFTAESLAKLKAKANEECNTKHAQISSFQDLSALVWRSITRTRHFNSDRITSCRLAINDRLRLNPPLSENYFGNCVQSVSGTTTVEELLAHGNGWAALLLHEAIKEHTDEKIRGVREEWMKKPRISQTRPIFDPVNLMMGSSPRFDVYSCDFGLGMAVAARCGFNNKFDGKVTSYRGLTGIGSVLLEVCLPPESMSALESDEEFMDAVSPHEIHWQHLPYV